MPKKLLGKIAAISALAASGAFAQSSGSFNIDDHFQRGWHEATVGSSVYISDLLVRFDRPDPYYCSGFLQAAYTVTPPVEGGMLRGSFQLAPEIFGAGVFHGPGHFFGGATLWFRYLFVQPGWRLVPFLEGGGGGTYIDIPHNFDGKAFNFNLDFGLGVRYFVCSNCSLDAEYRVQHISNANLWDHNIGLNAMGPSLGVTLYF
jgi:hypothetical protein